MDSPADPIAAVSSSPSRDASPNRESQAKTSTMNDSTQISTSDDSILVFSTLWYINDCWETLVNREWEKVDLNLSSSKFWIKHEIHSWGNKDLSLFLSKIYRFDGKKLHLYFQTISYDDLLLLSSNVECFYTEHVTVKYNDGSIVPLEKIVEAFPKIKLFWYEDSTPSCISSQTWKELQKLAQFRTLDFYEWSKIPEDFDLEQFYTYMKRNKRTRFYLRFSNSLSEAYKNRLEEIIDEIIETQNLNFRPPMIEFCGLNFEKKMKLEKVFYSKF